MLPVVEITLTLNYKNFDKVEKYHSLLQLFYFHLLALPEEGLLHALMANLY